MADPACEVVLWKHPHSKPEIDVVKKKDAASLF